MKGESVVILLVEDEPAHAEAILRALKGSGADMEIHTVQTLQAYREAVAANPPDIALLDLNLPNGRGVEVLTAPPEASPFPILIITSHGNEQMAVEAMKAGALDYIVKSPEAFVAMPRTVTHALREWRLLQERKQAEEALKEAAEKYRSLAASVDSMYLVDRDCAYLFMNEGHRMRFGLSLEEIIGRRYGEFHSEADAREFAEYVREVCETGKTVYQERWSERDGRCFLRTFTSVMKRSLSGETSEVVVVSKDITERKKDEEALKSSEKKYRQLMDTLQEGIWIIDSDGTTAFVNAAMAEIRGYTTDEMLGKGLFSFLDDQGVEIGKQILELCKQGIKKRCDSEFLRKDGTRIFTTLMTGPIFDERGNYTGAIASVIDITVRKQNEDQIQLHLKRIKALREIDMAITCSLDLRVTLNVILNQVTRQLNVDAAIVLLLDEPSLILEYAAGQGFHTSALQHTRLRLGEGLAGRAALERRIIISNLPDETGYLEQSPLLGKEGFQTYCAVPLIAKGHVKGVLEILHRSPIIPEKDWLDFLGALTTQAAIAIDNASLFNSLERSNIDLLLAYDTTLEGWSRALDLRDKETEGHSRRVTEMTTRLARDLGMTNGEIGHVRRGTLLHDIGKMAIPEAYC